MEKNRSAIAGKFSFNASASQFPMSLASFTRRSWVGGMLLLSAALLSGCAAFTNPVANGIPVRMLPDELLAESREDFEPIDLAMLRQPRPEFFKLDVGDTLGVYIEGIIGDENTPPPVSQAASSDEPPAIGYPFAVRANGTISLPLIDSINVVGLSIEEAEEKVKQAYRKQRIIRSDEENPRIIVTLMRPRTVRVLVVREDGSTPGFTVSNQSFRGLGSSSTTFGGGGGASGNALELPIYENDVLNALTSTGGLPSVASTQEVVIYRGYATGESLAGNGNLSSLEKTKNQADDGRRVIRIPFRQRCGSLVMIPRKDIILEDGDILTVRARDPEFYYTGGLLPSGEQALPSNYDLTVTEVVLRSRGPLINGGVNSSNLSGAIVGSGMGNPSPSQLTVLRQLPNGQQANILVDLNEALRDPRQNLLVQADDVLLLQENRDEALSRYFFNNVLQVDLFFRFLNRADAQGTASFTGP